MDIESLKELKSVVEAKSCRTEIDDDGEESVYEIDDKELMWVLEECAALIDEAIARQSVTDEAVRVALSWFTDLDDHEVVLRIKDSPDYTSAMPDTVVQTIITALQAYQPWIPCSERMPTEDDADENGHILAYSEGLQRSTICLWYHIIGDNVTTHWRENVEPPKGE